MLFVFHQIQAIAPEKPDSENSFIAP